MKQLKPFAKTFYSEYLLSGGEESAEAAEKEEVLIELEQKTGEEMMEWTTGEGIGKGYHGGLCVAHASPLSVCSRFLAADWYLNFLGILESQSPSSSPHHWTRH